jgi:hypothetical protein
MGHAPTSKFYSFRHSVDDWGGIDELALHQPKSASRPLHRYLSQSRTYFGPLDRAQPQKDESICRSTRSTRPQRKIGSRGVN